MGVIFLLRSKKFISPFTTVHSFFFFCRRDEERFSSPKTSLFSKTRRMNNVYNFWFFVKNVVLLIVWLEKTFIWGAKIVLRISPSSGVVVSGNVQGKKHILFSSDRTNNRIQWWNVQWWIVICGIHERNDNFITDVTQQLISCSISSFIQLNSTVWITRKRQGKSSLPRYLF